MKPASIRPSSLPALSLCPCFSGQESDYTQQGDARHKAFKAALEGDTKPLETLDDEDREGVEWAIDQARCETTSAYPLECEKPLKALLPDFETEMSGTADLVNGDTIFDLKWRYRNYFQQFCCYALMQMISNPQFLSIKFIALFGDQKRTQKMIITRDDAWSAVEKVLINVRSNPVPKICDYCGWCANCAECPEYAKRAEVVRAGREDWALEQYHSSQIAEPAEMARALHLAKALAKWAKAVEFKALQMVEKEGKAIPGFELAEKKGRQYCADIESTYKTVGLAPELFLSACDLRLNTSKTYPDKKGLIDVFKNANSIKARAQAKRAVMEKIEPFIKVGKSSKYLKAQNETTEEGEE